MMTMRKIQNKKEMTKEARRLTKKQTWRNKLKREAVKAARLVESKKMKP